MIPIEEIRTVSVGMPDTFEYRVFFEHDSKIISPFHDIPLQSRGDTYNFICEIPRGTNAKLEISKEEKFNPIKQDVKKGQLRFISYGNYPFHYGAFPQTWEDPKHIFEEIGYPGDDDPMDVCEIGSQDFATGQVVSVKLLGCLAMIDDDETDWKMIVIAESDPLASKVHDIDDVERELPGCLNELREWFRLYKVPEGKGHMKFGLDEKFQNKAYAVDVINKASNLWSNEYKK
jgi:inorganic pyrophosphatase